ncbi:MAG: HYExAFE family protein [Phycisphaerae bacterium]
MMDNWSLGSGGGVRRTHYETAFQQYLDGRGTPYVAIEDVRHGVKGRTGIKSFDYIVYPVGGRPCLVDVKGRKSAPPRGGADWRPKNWVTRADVVGLTEWPTVFGGDYEAVFVFAYWLVGAVDESGVAVGRRCAAAMTLAGRAYSFWLVRVAEYARHQRQISRRWDTVAIPHDVFRSIAHRVETCWPAAPC